VKGLINFYLRYCGPLQIYMHMVLTLPISIKLTTSPTF